jgi:BirA family biotin operon repressor/biotin-[acetyl-CoA-carboxylase] ligase
MDQKAIAARLAGLKLGGLRYFERLGSTNDEAAAWAQAGAADLSLVVAGEQTAGRGRAGRRWITPPASGLAFSLVLGLTDGERSEPVLPRLAALGALAVADGLESHFGLPAQIKWPNDVLVNRQKIAGVLAEAQWTGSVLATFVLGIGINVTPAFALEASRAGVALRFPATSVESALGRPVSRLDLLEAVLRQLVPWRRRLASPDFLRAWEEKLAFRAEWVRLLPGDEPADQGPARPAFPLEGQIVGLAQDGSLCLRTRAGETIAARAGEVRLLPDGE